MALSDQIGAYDDCFEFFEQAMANYPKGSRACFEDFGQANYFMFRLQKARALKRRENMQVYPRGDPAFGKSEFDKLRIKKPVKDVEGKWWVYLEAHRQQILAIEDVE